MLAVPVVYTRSASLGRGTDPPPSAGTRTRRRSSTRRSPGSPLRRTTSTSSAPRRTRACDETSVWKPDSSPATASSVTP